MTLRLPSKKVIRNGSNYMLTLPRVWLINVSYPDRVSLKIDDSGELVVSVEKEENS